MSSYWPWWAGALGLALVTINYTVITDRSLGVSAAWDRIVHWRAERRLERLDSQFLDSEALVGALAQATADEFGATAAFPPRSDGHTDTGNGGPGVESVEEQQAAVMRLRPVPLVTQTALLVSILVGGWIAAFSSGRFRIRFDMGEGFRQLVTSDPTVMVCVLFVGGLLVGFGTRLAGGCSSGHGLSGCGRLRPVSLLATAVFFGTAVVVSFLLWKVI